MEYQYDLTHDKAENMWLVYINGTLRYQTINKQNAEKYIADHKNLPWKE